MKRLQNKIAESRSTLPWTVVLAGAAWYVAAKETSPLTYLSTSLIGLAAYLTFLLNNRYTLIRIYSRTPSTSLIALSCCSIPFLLDTDGLIGLATACLMLLSYRLLFDAYQDKNSQGTIALVFTCTGISALAEPKVLCLVPLMWVLIKTKIMALSIRTAIASLLGLMLPFWLAASYLLSRHQATEWAVSWWNRLIETAPLADFSNWPQPMFLSVAFVGLLFVIGSLHFFQVSSNDSIKTRMFYHIFMTMGGTAIIMMALQPQEATWALPLLVANTSFLVAHFITFSHSRLTNITFIVITCMALGLTLFHLWTL